MNDLFLGMPEKTVQDAIAKRYLVKMVIQTTLSYKKAGIYSAEKNDTSKPITINWGDGIVEEIDGNVSQKVHNYENVGTFTVYISNVKTFAASGDNYDWYTTSQNSQTLKEVDLCSTITSIGDYAFAGCYGLTSVTIPDSVTNIESFAFHGCRGLTNVIIGESVQNIMYCVFYDCCNLTDITIPNSVTSIGENAFYNCISLISINIPNSIENIGNYAFYGCENLTLTFEGRTQADIDNMANRYWGLDSSHCIPG